VAVVRDDAPQDGVVTVGEIALKRHDQRPSPDDVGFSRENRAATVPDRLDPRPGPHHVVEHEPDGRRRRPEHRLVPRNRANEAGVSPRGGRKGHHEEKKDAEKSAEAQRFKKASGDRC
jgi:hypothetical protein